MVPNGQSNPLETDNRLPRIFVYSLLIETAPMITNLLLRSRQILQISTQIDSVSLSPMKLTTLYGELR